MDRVQFLQGLNSSIVAMQGASLCTDQSTKEIIVPPAWISIYDVLQTGDNQLWLVKVKSTGELYAYSPDSDSNVSIKETEQEPMNAFRLCTLLPIGEDAFIEQTSPTPTIKLKIGDVPNDSWDDQLTFND